MRKLHVAVDLDDVVLDFMPSVLDTFHKEYGARPYYDGNPWGEDAIKFSNHPLFKESGYENWWGWLRDREWLWSTFPAVPGAIGGIKRLRAAGHYVECVTSKPEWAEAQVWKWLGKWRPAFNRVTIVNSGQVKAAFTDAEIMVDDKLETCRQFIEVGRKSIWFDRSNPYQTRSHMPRAWSWDGIVDLVKTEAEALCTPQGSTQA